MSGYAKELSVITKAMYEAYENCFRDITSDIMDKAEFDIVTSNDLDIEQYMIAVIENNFPGDRILSEETKSDTENSGRTWTIDPIDGTYNMSRQIPLYGIQCSMYEDGSSAIAVIYLPMLKELYYAAKGEGAFLNHRRIFVSSRALDHSMISFGDFSHQRPNDFFDEHRLMNTLSEKVAKIRMLGSACIDFAYLASGRTDGTILFTKNKWDIAPGILLAREAGAIVKTVDGEYTEESRAVVAVSNYELYECVASHCSRLGITSKLPTA